MNAGGGFALRWSEKEQNIPSTQGGSIFSLDTFHCGNRLLCNTKKKSHPELAGPRVIFRHLASHLSDPFLLNSLSFYVLLVFCIVCVSIFKLEIKG